MGPCALRAAGAHGRHTCGTHAHARPRSPTESPHIVLTVLRAYGTVASRLGPCEKLLSYGKVVTSSRVADQHLWHTFHSCHVQQSCSITLPDTTHAQLFAWAVVRELDGKKACTQVTGLFIDDEGQVAEACWREGFLRYERIEITERPQSSGK